MPLKKKPNAGAATFGSLLTELMATGIGASEGRRWTDEALAFELDVEPGSIANWRRGRSVISQKNYTKLLAVFGLDRDNVEHRSQIAELDEARGQQTFRKQDRKRISKAKSSFLTFVTTFPTTPGSPVPRPTVESFLNENVLVANSGLCAIIAKGGNGKTTAVRDWLSLKQDAIRAKYTRCFIWSSYKQGQTPEFVTIDALFDDLVEFLSVKLPSAASTRAKAIACLAVLSEKPLLLVIDGVEALQYPPGAQWNQTGRFKDADAQEFFTVLSGGAASCAVLTSRLPVSLPEREKGQQVPQLQLQKMTKPEALQLLRNHGVAGTDAELSIYVEATHAHPLTLALTAIFIRRAFKVRLPTVDEISLSAPDEAPDARRAHQVLGSYLRWLPTAEAALLAICGLFDQPVPSSQIYLLTTTLVHSVHFRFDQLQNIRIFRFHLETLKSTGLIYDDDKFSDLIDVHPMIKEYLGQLLRLEYSELWSTANRALFAILQQEDNPTWGLRRIVYGCRGGIAQRAFDEVYKIRFSKLWGTASIGAEISYGKILYALNAFYDHGSAAMLCPDLDLQAKQTVLLDTISCITVLRGYADPQLPVLFELARTIECEDHDLSLRINYAECRFQRMAGNLRASKSFVERFIHNGQSSGDISVQVGGYRNASAYYFYVGDYEHSFQYAIEGERLNYHGNWMSDKMGFVNNPVVMLAGYAALAAARLAKWEEAKAAALRMNAAAEKSAEHHSPAIAAFIEAMLADFDGGVDLEDKARRFERLASAGELMQWLIAANILKAAAEGAHPESFERHIRRWTDTGAKLFLPYWYTLAGETAERAGNSEATQSFSARGLAIARMTGESWVNDRLTQLTLSCTHRPD